MVDLRNAAIGSLWMNRSGDVVEVVKILRDRIKFKVIERRPGSMACGSFNANPRTGINIYDFTECDIIEEFYKECPY
jgi:hypothetical protein